MEGEINNGDALKESVVKKIVSIFSDVPPKKNILIFADDVFAAARGRLEEMAKVAKAAYYEDIFDERLERLKTLGCPAFIIKKLLAKKKEVVSTACSLNIPDGRDSLIPVIPNHYLTIYSQLEMINFGGMTGGDTALESSNITNVFKKDIARNHVKIFDGVYFILDIDEGTNTENLTCAEAIEKMKGVNRMSLTVEEIIAVLLQKTEPPAFSLIAGGSRYGQDDVIPICINEDHKTVLKTCFYTTNHPNSVTPSCGVRV
ncbi:MAG: hypothetical protein JW943_01725 [Deltaproteobacteria bacterium]|nr:hypothetical protein [Deltaproteobacteria bacterium]